MSETVAAGWYVDPQGQERYWDGESWTADVRQTPSAPPPTADGAHRWQYRVVDLRSFHSPDRLGMTLSYFGRHGWELVTVYDKQSNWSGWERGFAMFKRPVPPGQAPEGPWAEVWGPEHVEAAYHQVWAEGGFAHS